ncbi:hypothetical protein [Pseudorhodobacter sp. MZDSW-24AT]|uniref:hypothetical protein n=1 Tax=Pseudorhodobacter sp. MZDSW-24AT TaxID=2052957 RepID=UPI000C1E638E|nr:hypothetical protein [Pseudorhodobacter sp. MZDSW-24AT]PJF09172.1 hypothetical protein CUR21_12070 [Pseudorhodobacter sp. MZDSW-24AT]
MRKSLFTAVPLMLALSLPAAADPTVGLGVTFTWGGGQRGDTGIGLRVFSDDERKKFVGSLGVDYLLRAQRVRPNVGFAYLASKSYVGMDIGFGGEGVDVGVGLGVANTRKKASPAPEIIDEGPDPDIDFETPPPV